VIRRPGLAVVVSLALLAGACAPKPAWELPPPPPGDAPIVPAERLTRETLENGLRVLLLEDHRLPRVTLGLTTRRGAASETLGEAGLAEFTAAVMERGAGDLDALALAEKVDALGATLSVSADWDAMAIRLSGLSRDLDALMSILADVALRPRFEPQEADKARAETLAAFERARDDPATLASWNSALALFPEHRYGLPLSGKPETVTGLDAADAREFHAKVFVPNDCIFSAVGEISADDLLARARRVFGDLPEMDPLPPGEAPPARPPPARSVRIVARPDLAPTRIVLATEGIARTAPDRIAASIMNSVLGGSGFSSRLMDRVRADAGLTYGVGSGFALWRQPSYFRVSTFTRNAEVRTVVDLLLAELSRMRTEPPTEAELGDAKTLAAGSFALSLETSDAVVGGLVDLDVYGLPEDSLDTYRARVRAVTAADAERQAERLLHPDRVSIVLVGPAADLRPQVEDLGPVEVVTP